MADSPLAEFVFPERLERLREVAAQRTRHLTLVLDALHHVHNISAVIRSADAFGIQEVHIVGGSCAFNRGVTIGAERWVDVVKHNNAEEAVSDLNARGYELVITRSETDVTALAVPVISVSELPFEKRLALVLGNEHSGVNDIFLSHAHYAAFIPMHGFVGSLNVSVAAAIFLYCSTVRVASEERRLPRLTKEEQDDLVRRWLKDDVRGAELILKSLEE